MFESKRERLLPWPRFLRRMLGALAMAALVLAAALALGVLGYRFLAGLGWLDALLNASMILTGMGPVAPLTTPAAKIFASLYALFSGLVFITVIAVALAPWVHRFLHRFHIDEADLKPPK